MIILIAQILALVGIFFIPVSPTLNGLIVVAALLTLLDKNWKENWRQVFSYKMTYAALALMILFFAGAFYNVNGILFGLKGFYKYFTYFIILFLLMPLFTESKWRERAVNVLIACTLFYALILMFGKTFTLSKHLAPIEFSILIAFTSFILLHRVVDLKKWNFQRGFNCFSLMFLLFVLYFVNAERTGMLLFFVMMILFGWQRFSLKGSLLALSSILLLTSFLWTTSSAFHSRMILAEQNIQQYSSNQNTSLAIRWHFLLSGIKLIQHHPIGLGTGLFTLGSDRVLSYQKRTLEDAWNKAELNPENAYLHIGLQIGILGVIFYLAWLLLQFYESGTLPLQEKRWAQGLVTVMVFSSFCILAFHLNRTTIFYCTFLAVFFAAGKIQKNLIKHGF